MGRINEKGHRKYKNNQTVCLLEQRNNEKKCAKIRMRGREEKLLTLTLKHCSIQTKNICEISWKHQ